MTTDNAPTTPEPALHCVCGDPIEPRTGPGWTHSPGSDTPCLEARPRCPHCGLPHDLTPGSAPVRLCEKVRSPEWQASVRPAVTVLESPDPAPGFEATVAGSPTPKAHQSTAPAPVDPALQQRIATVLFGAVSTANETPTATEQTIFATMAAAVLAELAPELARAQLGDRTREELASLAVNAANALRDEKRHYAIACAEIARLKELIDRLGPTEQKHRDDLATARAILADLTDPDPCWYDHHGYCQAHAWLATTPACPHARAKALTPPAAPEATP